MIGLPGEVERFRAAIARLFGLQFDDSKLEFLANILQERLDASRKNIREYLFSLESREPPQDELRALAAQLTVSETYFFRNIEQFRALREIVFSARSIFRKLNILSAACASGEETYSLAITAKEQNVAAEITGVDLNPVMLQRAERGRYSTWSLRETSEETIDRWFTRDGKDYVVAASIQKAVTFEERNLVTAGPELWRPSAYDVIFCRNVLMYFVPEHAVRVVEKIAESLVPGGYLFLGHAETLRGLSHDFHLRHTHGTFYYQRKEELARPQPTPPPIFERWETPPPIVFTPDTSWIELVQRSADRIHALADQSREQAHKSPPIAELNIALELLKGERFAEALEHLRELPPDDDVLLLRAVLLTHSGRLPAAEETCRELLASDELHAGAYYLLALCREGSGDRTGAIERDQIAAYLDPAFAMPHLHLGLLARRAGDLESARHALSRAAMLLQREDPSRILLFGGGFNREALLALCRAELARAGGER